MTGYSSTIRLGKKPAIRPESVLWAHASFPCRLDQETKNQEQLPRLSKPHVTRLDPRRLARGLVLLPFRSVLRGARTLGIGMARGTRAGEDVSAGADSGRCRFPPFSAWQLRRNHFAAAIGLAPSGRISGNLRRHRCRASPHIDPPVARGPRNGPAVSPTASSAAPTRLMRIRRSFDRSLFIRLVKLPITPFPD